MNKKLSFNEDWEVKRIGHDEEVKKITLPYDAMIYEKRSLSSTGGKNIGWFETSDYIFKKIFRLPENHDYKRILIEFEGVYKDAVVKVNSKTVMEHYYGYTGFTADITDFVDGIKENVIEVFVKNSDQPNSRWYTGTGIYRPVYIHYLEERDFVYDSLRIKTKDYSLGLVEIRVGLADTDIQSTVFVYDEQGTLVVSKIMECGKAIVQIPDVKLWSPESPYLYRLVVKSDTDELSDTFGVRQLCFDTENGFCINGKREIIKGACIHHDNGILGACAFEEAEYRKLKILKGCGYNAIRSAHNPCSKAMLYAADRLGMLIMDEYVDMWYIHKNKYDYALHMTDCFREDLKAMVDKDFNHPSVILYSTGNEVAETGQKKGIELTKVMTEYIHSLDDTRAVTCGINIFFNYLSSMGFGVYSDDKAKKEAQKLESNPNSKKKTVGSEFYNTLAGIFGSTTMKVGASLHGSDVKTRDAYANMDVAGYNYGILRYKKDLKKYPNRLILGSETFCSDAYEFYELAKNNNRLIGDFVWAGMDYMGEAGIGAWESERYAPKDADESGWLTAGSGRIDILGNPNGEALYTKVALGVAEGPYIVMRPVHLSGKHSPSAWKYTDCIESYSYLGYDGKKTKAQVFARCDHAIVYQNGREIKYLNMKKTPTETFDIEYISGELKVVAFDKDNKVLGEKILKTATEDTVLNFYLEDNLSGGVKRTLCEKRILSKLQDVEKFEISVPVKKNGLYFIQLESTDGEEIYKPTEDFFVEVENTSNCFLEGFGMASSYNPDGYKRNYVKMYFGRALMAIRALDDGIAVIKMSSKLQK